MSESKNRESGPKIGVTFNGTRRDVLIEDVIEIHGPRIPTSAESPRIHRQAFLYVVSQGRTPMPVRSRNSVHPPSVGGFLPAGRRQPDEAETRLSQ